MTINLDSSISIISIVAFIIFGVSFFFSVGELSQIKTSAFLENYDDKKKLIKNAKDSLFDFKTNAFKNLICSLPYFTTIAFCFSLSPFIIEQLIKYLPSCLPSEQTLSFFIFIILFSVFLIGEMLWGINEKYIIREHWRIHYNRPVINILFIFTLIGASVFVDAAITAEQKQIIMSFLGVNNINEFQYLYVFSIVGMLNILFVTKWISRYIVLIDHKIYINHLKEKNFYYSFYGMANIILSLVMILISVFLAVKYSVWEDINTAITFVSLLMMSLLSVLAGQRDYFVSITRKKTIKKNKLYYQDFNGKQRLLGSVK